VALLHLRARGLSAPTGRLGEQDDVITEGVMLGHEISVWASGRTSGAADTGSAELDKAMPELARNR
jgi:hypothetical protein